MPLKPMKSGSYWPFPPEHGPALECVNILIVPSSSAEKLHMQILTHNWTAHGERETKERSTLHCAHLSYLSPQGSGISAEERWE